MGLDLLPRRHAPGFSARDLRAAGLRLRRKGARRPSGARRLARPGLRGRAREAGGRSQAPFQSRLLGRGRRVLRRRARRRRPPGGHADVEQRPPALERHRRQVQGEGRRAAPDGARLFSGWGVRTLAEGEGRYNPIGYHVGTVWPFDNSFIAWGLRRYGFKEEAAQIAAGILDAAEFFHGRLPEAFGGYPRAMTKYPVQYPTACSPQAWSTGTPLLLAADDARPRADRRPPDRRSRATQRHRPPRAARHPRPLGPDRRLRARARRRREARRPELRGQDSPTIETEVHR